MPLLNKNLIGKSGILLGGEKKMSLKYFDN